MKLCLKSIWGAWRSLVTILALSFIPFYFLGFVLTPEQFLTNLDQLLESAFYPKKWSCRWKRHYNFSYLQVTNQIVSITDVQRSWYITNEILRRTSVFIRKNIRGEVHPGSVGTSGRTEGRGERGSKYSRASAVPLGLCSASHV